MIKVGRMSRKRFTAEQIIGFLRKADVKLSQGRNMRQICRVAKESIQIRLAAALMVPDDFPLIDIGYIYHARL